MKKKILFMALALVIGVTFYAVEGKADHTMGPELKGTGYGSGSAEITPGKSVERPQAVKMFEHYIESRKNPNLRLGKVEDTGRFFEANILDQNYSLIDVMTIDKETGNMKSGC
jgi:hypothetical protein